MTAEENRNLIERFSFLLPRNCWTGKVPEDYDYSYTELDAMPDGWRKTFGEQLCEELKAELVKVGTALHKSRKSMAPSVGMTLAPQKK